MEWHRCPNFDKNCLLGSITCFDAVKPFLDFVRPSLVVIVNLSSPQDIDRDEDDSPDFRSFPLTVLDSNDRENISDFNTPVADLQRGS